jgi:hypothetical protein
MERKLFTALQGDLGKAEQCTIQTGDSDGRKMCCIVCPVRIVRPACPRISGGLCASSQRRKKRNADLTRSASSPLGN